MTATLPRPVSSRARAPCPDVQNHDYGPEQHETQGRVRTHATRMCSRHGDEVLHEELVNAQVDTTQVLTECQHPQEHHQRATEPGQTSPAAQQREQATAAE